MKTIYWERGEEGSVGERERERDTHTHTHTHRRGGGGGGGGGKQREGGDGGRDRVEKRVGRGEREREIMDGSLRLINVSGLPPDELHMHNYSVCYHVQTRLQFTGQKRAGRWTCCKRTVRGWDGREGWLSSSPAELRAWTIPVLGNGYEHLLCIIF